MKSEIELIENVQSIDMMVNINKPRRNEFLFELRHGIKLSILDTTLHGINKPFKDHLHVVMKIIWLIFFFTCFGYCTYSIIISIQNYLEFPTIVSMNIINEVPAQFPAVTFCNMKVVNKTNSMAQDLVNKAEFMGQQVVFPSTLYQILGFDFFLSYLINNKLDATTRKAIGLQIEDMLIGCSFNYYACNSTEFKYFYHNQYGNCYTFNGDQPAKTVNIPGLMFGLQLELYLGDPTAALSYQDGIFISIHNQTEIPFSKMDVLKASPGADSDFIINRNFFKKISSPYGSCMAENFSSNLHDHIVNTLNITYSQEYCFSLCIQKQIILNCSCASDYLPKFDNTSSCNSATAAFCFNILINNFGDNNKYCNDECPFECNSIGFEITTNYGLYPTNKYADMLTKNLYNKGIVVNNTDVAKSFAKFNVYYNSMTYKSIVEKQQYVFVDLLSNIGGTLGLYLGMSLLSLIEIIELISVLVKNIIDYTILKHEISNTVKPKS